LLVIDHISSATATIFPVARIAQAAKRAGIAVLVDGAHVPGHLPLDVPVLGVDWYTGNAHKWLFALRGCGLLWTAPSRQAATFPAVLSHGTGEGYTEAFDWIGTRDVTPWLCFEKATDAHMKFGGEALMRRNRALAAEGAALIAEKLGSSVPTPAVLRGAMAAIPIASQPADLGIAPLMRRALASEYAIVAPIYGFAGQIWVRISAQIYNQLDDYERCSQALIKLRAAHLP
jgi:isopenicillin-N epimerase